jgi:GT2 family glycosyltransferase
MIRAVPDLSYAVVLTRDAGRAAMALRSIAAQAPPREVLLVLNDVDAPMRALARAAQAAGEARILHDGADLGVVGGWNLALRDAASPHVCVVHEDCELQPGCAARLLQTLGERPDAGAVGPRVLLADGSDRQEGAIVWSDGATSTVASLPADVHAVDYAGSSCLMLRREAALGVGGFDERFFPAMYVDASLGVSLWQAGRSVLCDRRAVNVHRRGAMVDATRGPHRGARMRSFLLARNRRRFQEAFGTWISGQADRANAADARSPDPAEIADALARARRRELELLAAPLGPLADRLVVAEDFEAVFVRLRRELEEDFVAELVDRERDLAEEAAGLHRSHAALHRDRDRVHREYAAQHAELDRVHAAYATLHAELERVHGESAALRGELERLRVLAPPAAATGGRGA